MSQIIRKIAQKKIADMSRNLRYFSSYRKYFLSENADICYHYMDKHQ